MFEPGSVIYCVPRVRSRLFWAEMVCGINRQRARTIRARNEWKGLSQPFWVEWKVLLCLMVRKQPLYDRFIWMKKLENRAMLQYVNCHQLVCVWCKIQTVDWYKKKLIADKNSLQINIVFRTSFYKNEEFCIYSMTITWMNKMKIHTWPIFA